MNVLVIMEIHQNESEDLAEIKARNHLFKSLLTRARRVAVDGDIEFGTRKYLVLVVESSPLAVDGHGSIRGQVHVRQFGNGAAVFHISSVAASSKDATNLHLSVGVGRSNHGTSGVVDERSELDRDALNRMLEMHRLSDQKREKTYALGESSFKHGNHVFTLYAGDVEALCPALENALIDVVLGCWVRESEAKG